MSSDESSSSSLSSSSMSEEVQPKRTSAAKGKKKVQATKRKLKKDPARPKRPTTAYMYFMQDKRPEILAAHPDWKGVAQVGKEAGRLWKTLSEAEKKPYNDMYNADKARYDTEMLTYKPDPAYATQGASKKRKKDPNAPKRPMNAYMHFTGVFREERKAKGLSILPRELGKAAGEAYKALTDTQKQKYLDMAAKDKKRYEQELAAYKESGGGDE